MQDVDYITQNPNSPTAYWLNNCSLDGNDRKKLRQLIVAVQKNRTPESSRKIFKELMQEDFGVCALLGGAGLLTLQMEPKGLSTLFCSVGTFGLGFFVILNCYMAVKLKKYRNEAKFAQEGFLSDEENKLLDELKYKYNFSDPYRLAILRQNKKKGVVSRDKSARFLRGCRQVGLYEEARQYAKEFHFENYHPQQTALRLIHHSGRVRT